MRLRTFQLKIEDLLTDPTIVERDGLPINSEVEKLIWPNQRVIVRRKSCSEFGEEYDGVAVYKPKEKPYDGKLLFVFLPKVIDKSVWYPAHKLLRGVNGGLDNRPDIIGEQMRMPRVRKSDGEVGKYQATPLSVMKTVGGRSDMLGYFRYKNQAPGVPDCDVADWTLRQPDIYDGVRELIANVDEVYRTCEYVKKEYKAQKAYMDTVPNDWKIQRPDGTRTNFTTMYVLKNHATAIHWDKFDEHDTFGVMTSLGDPEEPWDGCELVWPKFPIGCDYRPGDVLLADVHERHGNLFLPERCERISCIFFVRKGMHECPAIKRPNGVGVEATVENAN